MKDNNINCTAYSNGVNSPLEYLNITTPAEFKVVMDLLCYYNSEKKNVTISRTGIARDTAMSVSNVERALKTLADKDIIRIHNNYADNGCQITNSYEVAFINYDMDEDKLREAELALQFKS
ncbi:hypothetical protein [Ruminococcus sp.]|uniref:hypothetical protein n=1 Tax=Ruminococcus sp. TaxID=41978 RepID=UPI0025DBFE9E|nr:hypothetical protein [Ruminococcus sp.]MBR1432208.1 hypothetical protein [Ruminococcus sp.]